MARERRDTDRTDVRDSRPARGPARARGGASPGGPAQMGHALEVFRVAATFIVVLYHAALTYAATPLRLTLWVAYDASGHVAFDSFIYWVNGFAMPAFFLAAGVSAPAGCESRGPRVFLAHRARRLLRPLLFGCVTILPITYAIFAYGLLVTGRCDVESILSWRFSPYVRSYLYGFLHLWFLEYLFAVCVLWCGGWRLRKVLSRGAATGFEGGWADRLLRSPWKPLLLAIPTCLIFLVDSDTMLRVDNTIVPNLFRLLHYAFFFTVGGWLARVHDPKERLIPWGGLYLALSFVLFALMLPLLLRHASTPLQGWERVVFCIGAAVFPWLTVFGGLGVLLRVVQGRGVVMRFLTEGSFWVYLIHLPIVCLVQVVLLPTAWPSPVKFLVVAAVATGASLLSYEFIVRRSLIGEVVNGARKRSPKRGLFGPEFGWVATLALLLLMAGWGAWSSRVFFWGNNLHEEVPGKLYRSARLSPKDLDHLIRAKGIRTVVTFTGNSEDHPWFVAQKRVCESRRVELFPINLRADRAPSRLTLIELVDVLGRGPRPVLVQGYRGIDQSGFASAVAGLLGGVPPEQALRQFDTKYGQFGGPGRSRLGLVLLDYQGWLAANHWPHSPERFRAWAGRDDAVATGKGTSAAVR